MKEKPLTRDDIFMAADIVASTHVMPTITNVRELLGRGSETTLLKFLREWKEEMLHTYAVTKKLVIVPYSVKPEAQTGDLWRSEIAEDIREMLQG